MHGEVTHIGAQHRKMLPPFAKALRPFEGAVWIYCGKRSWTVRERQKGSTKEAAVLMPEGRQPSEYRWPVKDLDTYIVGLDSDLLVCSHLVIACLDEGASKVVLIHDCLAAGLQIFPGRRALKRCV
jgi:hypothetical protein